MTDDLTALRRMAEENARIAQETGVGSGSIAFEPQAVLALLDRLERAERELEVAMAPHSDCVESGERVGAQIDDLRSRAERAEAERDEARESRDGWAANAMEYATARQALERVRAAVSGHPECDRYEEGDVISCGWKSAYASVLAALDGAPEPEWEREYRRVRPEGVPVFNAVFETMPLLDDYYTAEYRTVSPWLPVEGESK